MTWLKHTCLLLFSFLLAGNLFAAEQLIIEPDAGRAPLLTALDNASSSIDLVMYGLTDTRFINTLIQAKKHGKNVQILLEPKPYKAEEENTFAIKRFRAANINLHWPNPLFRLTHQKTVVIDQRYAIIMTFNLTHSSFRNERNFALILDDPAVVQEIVRVFHADWEHENINLTQSRLIWSPDNSQEKILDFIRHAQKDIKIYAQDITDYQTIGALAKAARAGKQVDILTSEPDSERPNKKLSYLRKAGVNIHFSQHYVIHAKVILVDHTRAIVGSVNLTYPSMHDNRELSVITEDPAVIKQLVTTFQHDWEETV